MAGRYDANPFAEEEEEVNPFSVSFSRCYIYVQLLYLYLIMTSCAPFFRVLARFLLIWD